MLDGLQTCETLGGRTTTRESELEARVSQINTSLRWAPLFRLETNSKSSQDSGTSVW